MTIRGGTVQYAQKGDELEEDSMHDQLYRLEEPLYVLLPQSQPQPIAHRTRAALATFAPVARRTRAALAQ